MSFQLRRLFTSIFTLSALSAAAQPAAFDRGNAPQIQYNTGIPAGSRIQAPGAGARLTAQSHYRIAADGSGLQLVDSGAYSYSGTRSGDPLTALQFDTELRYDHTGLSARSVQTFNADNTVSGYRTQRFDAATGAWTALSRHTIAYRNGVRIADTGWNWDAATQAWIPFSYGVRELDGNGLPVVFTRFLWNAGEGRYDSATQLRSRYDAAGNLAERIVRHGNRRLSLASRSRYTYNGANAATAVITDRWDASTRTWAPGPGQQFELDAKSQRISQTNLEPDGESGHFRAATAYTYKRDNRGNVIEMTGSGDRVSFSYDTRGLCTGMTRVALDRGIVTEIRRYYYGGAAAGDHSGTIKVWPVPAGKVLHFDAAIAGGQAYGVEITTADGRLVRKVATETAIGQLAVEGLPAGMYVLTLRLATGVSYQSRFTIVK